jgi:2-oxoglutarate ferredoxin oxidoreductase subunit alpha
MNQRLCQPLQRDASRVFDRGKVMSAQHLEDGMEFGRYKEVDGDGIPYRTYPGTHPSKGSFFTRGTTKNAFAGYSERGPDYLYNMHRLQKKFDTAKALVPQPVINRTKQATPFAAIYFGSTSPSMTEAIDVLDSEQTHLDTLRLRAFPFPNLVSSFIAEHKFVFVVEQNRDEQMRSLLINEFDIDPAKLIAILHYDGTPITARFIVNAINSQINKLYITSMKSKKVVTP